MSLKPGDQITFRLMPAIMRYTGTMLSVDERSIAFRMHDDAPAEVLPGQYLMITETFTDAEHYNEVVSRDGSTVNVRRMWTSKRDYFRVDDFFPVLCRKVDATAMRRASAIISRMDLDPREMESPDPSVSTKVWKMLVDINIKLAMIQERLDLESEGLHKSKSVPVNISASGIRVQLDHQADMNEIYEIKLLLPAYPPIGIVAYGTVVRIDPVANGFYVSFSFEHLTDEVQDAIVQYSLRRQREVIRRERETREE